MRVRRQEVGARFSAVGILASVVLMAACSIPKSYYPAPQKSIRDLPVLDRHIKRVGLCRFRHLGSAGSRDLAERFEDAVSAALTRNCDKTDIVFATADAAPSFLKTPPLLDSDQVDLFSLAQQARRAGFQVLVQGRLLSLNHRVDRSGWSRFRKSRHYLDMRLQTEAIDAVTAAKIAQFTKMITLPIDAATGDAVEKGARVDLPALVERIGETGIELALKLCAPIRSHPWQTVVNAVQGSDMVLAAGAAAGFAAGDRLAVFDGSRTISGSGGERFVLAGFQLGVAIVKQSDANGILATGEGEEPFPPGSILVPLR